MAKPYTIIRLIKERRIKGIVYLLNVIIQTIPKTAANEYRDEDIKKLKKNKDWDYDKENSINYFISCNS